MTLFHWLTASNGTAPNPKNSAIGTNTLSVPACKYRRERDAISPKIPVPFHFVKKYRFEMFFRKVWLE